MISNVSSMEEKIEYINKNFPTKITWRGTQGTALCPFHDDHNPSFSINVDTGLWICHAGCGKGNLKMLMEKLPSGKLKTWADEIEYIYRDVNNNPLFMVGRNGHGKGKKFKQYHYKDKQWWTGKGDNKNIPYNLNNIINAIENNQTIYIVEGEKDVETLSAHGLIGTTNVGGAGKWPDTKEYNKYFLDANVVILPDNDKVGIKHADKVATILREYAKSIKIVNLTELNEKEDITDWFKNGHTDDELLKLVEEANEYESNKLIVLDGKQQWINIRQKYFDGNAFIPVRLAEDILQRQPMFYYGQQLYCYEHGTYRAYGERAIRKWCKELLGEEYRQNRVSEVKHYIETATWLIDEQAINPDDGLINVKNGLLDWRTGKLLEHTPERLSTIQIPVDYNPNSQCPEIEQFLLNSVMEEEIPALIEFSGYCLIPNTRHQKAALLNGKAGSGKSVFINLLQTFVGNENNTSISLQDLNEHKFKRALLKGKLLNSLADISPRAAEDSYIFKCIVSGDTIDGELKGKDSFEFRPFVKLLFSANELPGTRDTSDGYYSKWILINFPNVFRGTGKEDKNLINRLTTDDELSGFLNLVILGLKRLEENNGFTISDSMIQASDQYKDNTDNMTAFLNEMCVFHISAYISQPDFYKVYKIWCENSGLRPMGKIKFNQKVRMLPDIIEKTINGTIFWGGCTLKSDFEKSI